MSDEMMKELLKELVKGTSLPAEFFGTKTSPEEKDIKRARFPYIVAPILDTFKPNHCIVDHLKSCNVANQIPT